MVDELNPLRVVVMGASGSGKSTIGERLAAELGTAYLDADEAHPAENVTKMSAGVPLTDEDRQPWLQRLADELEAGDRIVVTSSALKQSYRDVLRRAGSVRFVFLDVSEAEAARRVGMRPGHFMGADMVESQFATLERPTADETDITTVNADRPIDAVVAAARAAVANESWE